MKPRSQKKSKPAAQKTLLKKSSNGKDKALKSGGMERRSALRRPVLETFSSFVVLPDVGFVRLKVNDLSEKGIGFDFDVEDEPRWDNVVTLGDELDARFYINQSLYIPLRLIVRRVDETIKIRRVGAEFVRKTDADFRAFLAFLGVIDRVLETLQIDPNEAKFSR